MNNYLKIEETRWNAISKSARLEILRVLDRLIVVDTEGVEEVRKHRV